VELRLILRGFGVGALGGLLAWVFARVMTEPVIQSAINYESGRDAVADSLRKTAGLTPAPPGPDIFSRAVQRTEGIGTGLILFGLAMGGLFTVAYIIAYRWSGGRVGPRLLAALVAGGCFLAIYLIPFLKYPANPPAIGREQTIHARGLLYLGLTVISVVAVVLAVFVAAKLSARIGGWNAALLSGLGLVVVLGVVMAVLPALGHLHYNEVHFGNLATETPQPLKNAKGAIVYPGFPADVLYKFRLYSIINQFILWATIGIGFGWLAERLLAGAGAPAARADLVSDAAGRYP
jgi:hypothetical protein